MIVPGMFVFFDDRLLLHFLGLPERPMKRNQARLKVGNCVTGPAKGKEMLAREKTPEPREPN